MNRLLFAFKYYVLILFCVELGKEGMESLPESYIWIINTLLIGSIVQLFWLRYTERVEEGLLKIAPVVIGAIAYVASNQHTHAVRTSNLETLFLSIFMIMGIFAPIVHYEAQKAFHRYNKQIEL